MIVAPYLVPWFIRLSKHRLPKGVWDFPARGREVALTFDDGPSRFTPGLLAVLQHHSVPATFFILGDRTVRQPEIASSLARHGHSIGFHGYHHCSFNRHPMALTLENLERGRRALESLPGGPAGATRLCRPPFGYCRPDVLDSLLVADWRPVFCGVLPGEHLFYPSGWRETPVLTVSRVRRDLRPGLIIALHDGEQIEEQDRVFDSPQVGEVAAAVIREVRAQGYEFAALPDRVQT